MPSGIEYPSGRNTRSDQGPRKRRLRARPPPFHAPSASGLFERSRIRHHEASALSGKERRVGLRQRTGIGNETGRRQIYRAGELTAQIGLARCDRRAIENFTGHSILPGALHILGGVGKACLGAKQFEPAGSPQQLRNAGLRDQRLVLGKTALDQRQLGDRAMQCTIRRGCEEIAHQPGEEMRQIGKAIMSLRRAVQRVLHDLGKIAGKHVGENGSAFDQAGIPETGFFAGELVPVDQDDLSPALLQVQGGADANHSSAQYEDIGLQFCHPALP